MRTLTMVAIAAGVLVLGMAAAAGANSIQPVGLTVTGGPIWTWSYTLNIDSAQYIPASSGPCQTTGTSGSETSCTFFTIFDVLGDPSTASFTSSVPGLTGTTYIQNTGPVAFNSSVPDDSSLPNVGVEFANSNTTSITGTDLGVLSFNDSIGDQVLGNYSAQANLSLSGSASGNQGQVPSPAPEPGSLTLLSSGVLGMVGLGLGRSRRKRHLAIPGVD